MSRLVQQTTTAAFGSLRQQQTQVMRQIVQKRAINTEAIVAKAKGVAEPIIFYARVGGEFVRQVASHQKITAPGSLGDASQGLTSFINALQNGSWRKVTVSQASTLAGHGVTILGFFLAGEMVGRWSIVGYDVPG
ncbi:hypothetical protein HK102_012641, partial [Quaeritorhiza haematococci]